MVVLYASISVLNLMRANLMCIFFKASFDQAIKNNYTNQQKWLPSANQISAVNNLYEAVY